MSSTEKKNYLLPIIVMILLFGMVSFVTNLAAPMGVVLKNQFGASNAEGMLGVLANFIAYAFMGIPAGILLKKIGYKKTALIAIVVGFVGIGIQYLSGGAGSFAIYLIGAFVAGFSMCMLNTVVNPMLNTLGGGGNKGGALIQTGGTFNSLCGTLVPVLVGVFVADVTKANIKDVYPVMYIAMGVFAFAFIILALVQIPEPHMEVKKAIDNVKDKYSALSFRHFVLGAIGIFVYVGVEVGIPGTLNLFLADKSIAGLDATSAGFVTGTYWFLMLIGRFFGASIGSKVSSKSMLTVAAGLGLVLVLLAIFLPITTRVSMPVFQSINGSLSFGMMQVPINAMFLVLCGLCTSVMWGGIFNLAVEGLGKYVTTASGIFMTLVCGGGILPLLQNFLADSVGYMASYWVVFVGLAYLLYYAAISSRNVNTNIPVE
ncbi:MULTISPECIES: MFS transporter [unclassified Dysgonomonas]|uniref:MFS transporter n=1 Tax=unclassified Dysgonomonas TaxID=2630389 RepID=UPI0025C4539A|nr:MULTISPECIES: MFS transporter [unclassified Dysgonomonas]